MHLLPLMACVRVFSLSISATQFPSDLRVGGMGLSMADTHLKQSRLPSGRLRILIQPLSDDSDMMTEVMTLRSSVYRASGWKLKMEGRLKGE